MAKHFRICASTGIKVDLTEKHDNWFIGKVTLPTGEVFKYEAKVYDEPSYYGIDDGCISKLWIQTNSKTVCNYDRGWDVKPKDAKTKSAYKAILNKYN